MLLDFNRALYGHTPQQRSTHLGMAHFAGTGPIDAMCGSCDFWAKDGARRSYVCGKARLLGTYSKQHIPGDTAACKYFEKRAQQS